jgi:5-methyltetrahydrofolate--homocysteine methyltransferase
VRNAHTAYIHAGADIITTNTFNTARHVLEPAGYGEDVALLNRRAVELAREVRNEAAARDVWIAGSLSCVPPHSEFRNGTPSDAKARDNYREQASILAEAGVDLLITEMMLDPQNAALVTEAAREMDLPVWNGMSAQVSGDGIMMAWRGRVDLILSTPEWSCPDLVNGLVKNGLFIVERTHPCG